MAGDANHISQFFTESVELNKGPSFFSRIPPNKVGFSYSFSFKTQPFRPPFALTAQTQTTLSLSHLSHTFPPFSHRSIFPS